MRRDHFLFELCEGVASSSVFGDYVQDGGERGVFLGSTDRLNTKKE
jgi:hypothetical protein